MLSLEASEGDRGSTVDRDDRRAAGADGGELELHVAYCAACDREVRVLAPAGFERRERLDAHDIAALICLDYGESCTGAFCPFSGTPPGEPGDRAAPKGEAASW